MIVLYIHIYILENNRDRMKLNEKTNLNMSHY